MKITLLLALLSQLCFGFQNGTSDRITLSGSQQIGTYYTYFLPGYQGNPKASGPGGYAGQTYTQAGASTQFIAQKGASTISLLSTNLDNSGYHHLQILNETAYPLSVAFTHDRTVVPQSFSLNGSSQQTLFTPNGMQKYYVLSSGTNTFDNVAIGDSIYVMSENGQSVTAGTITYSVWGSE